MIVLLTSVIIEMDGVKLSFDAEALEAIASKAIDRNTGARGLRAILEELMLEVMYDVPSHNDIEEVVITHDAVLGNAKPSYIYKNA